MCIYIHECLRGTQPETKSAHIIMYVYIQMYCYIHNTHARTYSRAHIRAQEPCVTTSIGHLCINYES